VCAGLKVVTVLHDGAVFGEMALLIDNQPRTATIRALVFSDVFELSKQDLEEVMVLWPTLRAQLEATMKERIDSSKEILSHVNRKGSAVLSPYLGRANAIDDASSDEDELMSATKRGSSESRSLWKKAVKEARKVSNVGQDK